MVPELRDPGAIQIQLGLLVLNVPTAMVRAWIAAQVDGLLGQLPRPLIKIGIRRYGLGQLRQMAADVEKATGVPFRPFAPPARGEGDFVAYCRDYAIDVQLAIASAQPWRLTFEDPGDGTLTLTGLIPTGATPLAGIFAAYAAPVDAGHARAAASDPYREVDSAAGAARTRPDAADQRGAERSLVPARHVRKRENDLRQAARERAAALVPARADVRVR